MSLAERKDMSVLLSILAIVPLFAHAQAQAPDQSPAEEDIVIGRRTGMHSEILGEWRPLEVYLPGSFRETESAYPVLIVLDGGWFFRYCVSIVDMMSPNHFPEMIVVGPPNTDRGRDLNPVDESPGRPGAGTDRFRRFLGEELFPYLAEHYRIEPYRILAGHSLAGLSAVHCLFTEPELFNAAIATSPSLQRPERRASVHAAVDALAADRMAGRFLYVSAGGAEPERMYTGVADLVALCADREDLKLQFISNAFPEEGHVPVKGFYEGMRSLFSD